MRALFEEWAVFVVHRLPSTISYSQLFLSFYCYCSMFNVPLFITGREGRTPSLWKRSFDLCACAFFTGKSEVMTAFEGYNKYKFGWLVVSPLDVNNELLCAFVTTPIVTIPMAAVFY